MALDREHRAEFVQRITPQLVTILRELRTHGDQNPRGTLKSYFDRTDTGTGHEHCDLLIRLQIPDTGAVDPASFNQAVDAAMGQL